MFWLAIRVLPIPALVAADPAILFAYRYWHNLKEGGWLPPRCRVDTPQFRLIVPGAQWIDLRARGGVPDLGPLEPLASVRHADGGEVDGGPRLGDELAAALGVAAATGTPLFQTIELRCRTRPVAYQQLVLPVADDGSRPTELLHLCHRGELNLQSSLLRDPA
ncbi:MAG: hypothetical protein KDG89_02255 [Geminicoccaceae bacterium]|nr:hypothetical protein [Geminicoccaceae bacterium]